MARILGCALASSLIFLGGCGDFRLVSTKPMGEPIDLGGACEQEPTPTGIDPGDVLANIVGFDQYGEEIDLYADLCDRHVVIARHGFD